MSYVRHMKLHRYLPNATFKCGIANCSLVFKSFNAFKSHSYRYHNERQPVALAQLCSNVTDLTCHIECCSVHCEDLAGFFSHLKSHLKEGTAVTCPFKQCKKTYSVLSTFTSHLSRCHKGKTEHSLIETIVQITGASQGSSLESMVHSEDRCEADNSNQMTVDEICPEHVVDDEMFLKNLSLFYLKLQAKLLLPASVIQAIIEGFQEIHDMSLSNMLNKLKEKLILLGVTDRHRKSGR